MTIRIASARTTGTRSHRGNRRRRTAHSLPDSTRKRDERRRDAKLALTRDVRYDDPEVEVLRAYIREQRCWWCGNGPFRVLALHTVNAHGINRFELRRLADVAGRTSICSPEHSIVMADNGKKQDFDRLRAMLEESRDTEQQRAALQLALERTRKPHKCTNPACNNIVPVATRKSCSAECRRIIREMTAREAGRKVAELGVNRRPHNCPTCGTLISTSQPKFCSDDCRLTMVYDRKAYHACTVCGGDTSTHRKRTCSPECRAEARRRVGAANMLNLWNRNKPVIEIIPVYLDSVAPDELWIAIENQQCCFCAAPEVRSLSQHWVRKHGINLQDIRDCLGVPKHYSFQSEATRALQAERGRRNYDPSTLKNRGNPRQFSAYGVRIQREKIALAQQVQIALGARNIPRTCQVCGDTFYAPNGKIVKTCKQLECRSRIKSIGLTGVPKKRKVLT